MLFVHGGMVSQYDIIVNRGRGFCEDESVRASHTLGAGMILSLCAPPPGKHGLDELEAFIRTAKFPAGVAFVVICGPAHRIFGG